MTGFTRKEKNPSYSKLIDLLNNLERRYGEISKWKIASLFFGVQDITGLPDPLNPNFLKRAGFSAARNIIIKNITPAKIPTQNSMIGAKYSPFLYNGKYLINEINNEKIKASDFPIKIPPQIENLLPTTSGTVGIMSFSGCILFDYKKQCEFCTVGSTKGKKPLSKERIVSELEKLVETGYQIKNITINTGQLAEPGKDLKIIGDIARAIKEKYPDYPIAAEVGPFSFLCKGENLDKYLRKIGLNLIDTFMINLELIDDNARKRLCPAKPKIEDYKNLMFALSDTGYQVSSVIQLNFYPELEKIEKVGNFIQDIMKAGKGNIIPEFLISRAVPGSNLNDLYWKKLGGKISKEEAQFLMINRLKQFVDRLNYLIEFLGAKEFDSNKIKAGCVKCGMCNINKEINQNFSG